MARDITREEIEYFGAAEVRFFEVDITNYDSDGSGDGEAFDTSDTGMSRHQMIECEVMPNEGGGATTVVNAVAQYDYANNAIRLFYAGTDGSELSEVSSNVDEGAVVKVKAIGR